MWPRGRARDSQYHKYEQTIAAVEEDLKDLKVGKWSFKFGMNDLSQGGRDASSPRI